MEPELPKGGIKSEPTSSPEAGGGPEMSYVSCPIAPTLCSSGSLWSQEPMIRTSAAVWKVIPSPGNGEARKGQSQTRIQRGPRAACRLW